jgi:hypothetical protein
LFSKFTTYFLNKKTSPLSQAERQPVFVFLAKQSSLFSDSYKLRSGNFRVRIPGDNLLPPFLYTPFDEQEVFGNDVFNI